MAKPAPGLSEILVAVHAAGINPTDWKNRTQPLTVTAELPLILGWDVSGVVEAVGVGVTLFKPGDEVFGMLPYPGGVGSHAEYVTGPARAFTHKPAGIDHIQAGALPLAALTAYQALVDTADVQAGQRVLIHAAAGGVGHLAVQIAKSRGAYVIGTASAAKHNFVRSLGADEVIDYHTVDFTKAVGDTDVVLDPISFDTEGRARSSPYCERAAPSFRSCRYRSRPANSRRSPNGASATSHCSSRRTTPACRRSPSSPRPVLCAPTSRPPSRSPRPPRPTPSAKPAAPAARSS